MFQYFTNSTLFKFYHNPRGRYRFLKTLFCTKIGVVTKPSPSCSGRKSENRGATWSAWHQSPCSEWEPLVGKKTKLPSPLLNQKFSFLLNTAEVARYGLNFNSVTMSISHPWVKDTYVNERRQIRARPLDDQHNILFGHIVGCQGHVRMERCPTGKMAHRSSTHSGKGFEIKQKKKFFLINNIKLTETNCFLFSVSIDR